MKSIPADWSHVFVVPESLHAELLEYWEREERSPNTGNWEHTTRAAEHFINQHPGERWGRLAVTMDLLQLLDRAADVQKRLQGEQIAGSQTVIE